MTQPIVFSKSSGNPIFGQIFGHKRAENETRKTKMYRGQETHPIRVNARYEMNWANSFFFQKVPETLSTDGRTDRRTDRHRGESSKPPVHLRWSGGITTYNEILHLYPVIYMTISTYIMWLFVFLRLKLDSRLLSAYLVWLGMYVTVRITFDWLYCFLYQYIYQELFVLEIFLFILSAGMRTAANSIYHIQRAYDVGWQDINTLKSRQIDAISQTTFSNAFSWMKILEFRLKFHWRLFLRVQLTIFQQWFR